MAQLENRKLEGLKLQHGQKVNELEKMQVAVLEVSKGLLLGNRGISRQNAAVARTEISPLSKHPKPSFCLCLKFNICFPCFHCKIYKFHP